MIKVTVRFGVDTWNRSYPQGATISNIFADHDLKMVAGWTDNVRATVQGVEQPSTAQLSEGMLVNIETRANDKAS